MSISGVRPIHFWSSLAGIIPSTNNNQHEPINRLRDQTVGGFLIIAVIAANIYNWYGKFTVYGSQAHRTVIFTFSLMEVVATIINIATIYYLNLKHGPRFIKFLNSLENLEVYIVDQVKVKKANRNIVVQFYTSFLVVILFSSLSVYVYLADVGWAIYQFFAFREIQNFYIIFLTNIICVYPLVIGMRMEELNDHLLNCVSNSGKSTIIKESGYQFRSKPRYSVKQLSESFTTVAELIDEYNTIFGPLCVGFAGLLVLYILVPINMALLFVQQIPIYHSTEVVLGIAFLVFCMSWIFIAFVLGVQLFTVCNKTERETRKVQILCYQQMKAVGESNYKLRNDLEDYANQADRLQPQFSADGYFAINNTLTMSIFGSIFTYVIVLMQFQNI